MYPHQLHQQRQTFITLANLSDATERYDGQLLYKSSQQKHTHNIKTLTFSSHYVFLSLLFLIIN